MYFVHQQIISGFSHISGLFLTICWHPWLSILVSDNILSECVYFLITMSDFYGIFRSCYVFTNVLYPVYVCVVLCFVCMFSFSCPFSYIRLSFVCPWEPHITVGIGTLPAGQTSPSVNIIMYFDLYHFKYWIISSSTGRITWISGCPY